MADNYNWAALARTLWKEAQIEGNGMYACVIRCAGPHFTRVVLFDSWQATKDFAHTQCGFDCSRKHTTGTLEKRRQDRPTTPRGMAIAAMIEASA